MILFINMKNFIQILLITLLYINDCSLENDEKKSSRDVSDYDLQEKDYQSIPTKSQGAGLHENDFRKLGSLTNNMNGEHKSAYVGQHGKYRVRHSRNGKVNKKRRASDMGNIILEYPELQNLLQNNVQEQNQRRLNNAGELNVETSALPEGSDVDKHVPSKKHATAKRWPLKRSRKFHGFKEAPRIAKSEHRQALNEEFFCDYNDADIESKAKKFLKLENVSTVIVPESNLPILLKSLKDVDKKLGNERSESNEQGDQRLIMRMKNGYPQFVGMLSKENDTFEDTVCKAANESEEKSDHNELDGTNGSDSVENLKLKLKEEILNCTSAGLNKYLKLFGKKGEKSAKVDDYNENGKTFTGGDYNEQGKSDLMNLNITINGLVMNNDKPSKIHGNGTIKVNPSYDEERKRRAVKCPSRKNLKKQNEAADDECDADAEDETEKPEPKKACKQRVQKPNANNEESSNPDVGLTPDKLSNEIVKMVSHMVRSNPKMKTLWPSLRRNRPMNKGAACNLRTTANCSGRKQIEDMLRKAMASVNDIIEKEVQSRSCVPLSEDLAEFYEVILEMHAKQAKRKEEREEMLIQAEKLDKEPTDSEEKPKKKTCKQKPKRDEQDADLQDNQLFDMMRLRRLQYDEEIAEARRRREAEKRTHELILDTANSSLVRKLRQMYSPAFLKLNSVVESLQRSEAVPEQL